VTSDITRESVFLSAHGGILDFIQDGEILASVAVPAGRVQAREYVDLCPFGAEIHAAEGLAVVQPRRLGGRQSYGEGSHETGANPDFRPTSASRFEMEMRLQMKQLQASAKRIEARERALASIERVPLNPAPAPAPEPAPTDDKPVIE
jgi:hypothetical protein